MLPVVVFMLLACALSAAFLLRPEGQGTGNTYQAHNHFLITRHDALQRQPHQPLVSDIAGTKLTLHQWHTLSGCHTANASAERWGG